jgi:16S rRNA (uracil1498-N3)-methyltransferase
MSQRFFCETPIVGEEARLVGDEARHLSGVMRGKIGDELVLFDGSGAEFRARIARLTKQAVELAIVERREISRESACHVTLAVALPKGERQRWLVEKAVELGVATLIPLETRRGVAEASGSALERMRRWVIEASKQCGRNRLLEIAAPMIVEKLGGEGAPALRLVAHPGDGSPAKPDRAAGSLLIAIGPEGGFTPEEINSLRDRGFQVVSLGPRILRIETAAIALASLWLTEPRS